MRLPVVATGPLGPFIGPRARFLRQRGRQPPVQSASCDPVPGLETVFARGDEDAPENHRCAVESKPCLSQGRSDRSRRSRRRAGGGRGASRYPGSVQARRGKASRCDVREIPTESDAAGRYAAAVAPRGPSVCSRRGSRRQRIGTQRPRPSAARHPSPSRRGQARTMTGGPQK